MKKNELFIALVFTLFIVLFKTGVPYFEFITLLSVLYVTIFFITRLKNSEFWKGKPWLAVYSAYYKIFFYISVLFMAMHYPGRDIIALTAVLVTYLYIFIVYNYENNKKEALHAFIYTIIGVFLIFVLRSIS